MVIILLTLGLFWFVTYDKPKQNRLDRLFHITLGNTSILVELAETSQEITLGLSGRKSLPQNQGLFFIYAQSNIPSFWMKNMRFPIDIIWIDADYNITDITRAVQPNSYPATFQPKTPILYVLEVNSGWADKNNAVIGSKVNLNKLTFIKINKPKTNEIVKSPLTIEGIARGAWFFEASAPIRLLDANNKELAAGHIETKSDWMTADFVPFKATVEFTQPETAQGILIIEKDNPSDLPENSNEIQIPVYFR